MIRRINSWKILGSMRSSEVVKELKKQGYISEVKSVISEFTQYESDSKSWMC